MAAAAPDPYCCFTETPALVLLSGHAGGRVQESLAGVTGLLGGSQTAAFRQQAEAMIADGRGDALMMLPGWWYVASANSYLDRLTTMPDTVATAPRVKCPVLFIRGDQERREAYPAEDFAAACGGPCDVEIVTNCDHYYKGREDTITELVAGWLARQFALSCKA